jgi:predicted DNA-binding protein
VAVQAEQMPVLTAGNTVYTHPVAKVMISVPDELLERVDSHASATGETRSGFLQRLAERELETVEGLRLAEARRLLDLVRADFNDAEPAIDAARLIREDRESH